MHYYNAIYAVFALSVGAFLPILLDGVERKLRAALQSRIGPPITQTLYDLLKLAVKELKPVHTVPFILLCFTSFILCAFTSAYLAFLFAITGDLLIFALAISFLAVSLTALTLIPLLVPNPFSYIGGMRDVILALVNESSFIASLIIYSVILGITKASNVATLHLIVIVSTLLVMVISGYALTGRAPFDIAEAEPELASGTHIEFSGKLLALYLYANLFKKFLAKIFIAISIIALISNLEVYSLLLAYLLTLLMWIAFAAIAVTLGRSRVDLAPRTLMKVYTVLLTISITGLLVTAYA